VHYVTQIFKAVPFDVDETTIQNYLNDPVITLTEVLVSPAKRGLSVQVQVIKVLL